MKDRRPQNVETNGGKRIDEEGKNRSNSFDFISLFVAFQKWAGYNQ